MNFRADPARSLRVEKNEHGDSAHSCYSTGVPAALCVDIP